MYINSVLSKRMFHELINPQNYHFLNNYSIPNLIVGLVFLWLAFFVFFKNHTNWKNIIISFFNLCAAWWQLWFFLAYNTINPSLAYFIIRIGFIGVIFLPIAGMHFFISYIDGYEKQRKIIWSCYFASFIVIALLFNTDWILSGVHRYFWGYYTTAGRLFSIFLSFYFLEMSYYIYCLISNLYFKKSNKDPELIKALKLFAIGILLIIPGSIDFLPNYGLEIYPFGFICFLNFSIILMYTIVNYKLLDIETVFHKTLVWFFTSLFVLLPMFLILLPLVNFIKKFNLLQVVTFYIVFFIIFSWYEQKIHSQVNIIFRRKKYHYQEALLESIKEVFTSEDLEAACEKLYANIYHIFYPKNLVIFVYRNGMLEVGFRSKGGKKLTIGEGNTTLSWLKENRKPLFKENIRLSANARDAELYSWLSREEVEGLVPIVFRDNILGVVAIGRKENLKYYNDRDIKLLEKICKKAGPAINNFIQSEKLVQKEIDFNQYLESEFQNRTKQLAEKNLELQRINQQTEKKRQIIEDLKSQVSSLKAIIS